MNQCDGCRAGIPARVVELPISGRVVLMHGRHMVCTRDRYEPPVPDADRQEGMRLELKLIAAIARGAGGGVKR